ncbi:hypothetical protein VH22019_00037 [Vibrio phage VH2_2019]|nr:hypothetical protein VH22019_00037 [Vibrio phage VH2_2019]
MALVIKRKAPKPSVANDDPVRQIDIVAPLDNPSHVVTTVGVPCHLHLAWNNGEGVKSYAVWCNNKWIGNLETAGGEQVACKARVPKDYSNLVSKPRISPTGCNMADGCYLLLKHAGVLPNDPKPNPKVEIDLSEYNIPF